MDRRELTFSAAGDAGQVFDALAGRYQVQAGAPVLGSWTCLDTADWRLHDAGLTLRDARSGRRAELVLGNGGSDPLISPTRVRAWPARIDAIPASPVRDALAGPVGVRALLPLAEVDVRAMPLTLRDDEGKIRVRVRVDQQRLRGPSARGHQPLPLRVLISPLRGYLDDADRCAELLAAAVPALADERSAITIAMATAGHHPGVPPVADLALDPDAPAVRSLAAILRRYLVIAREALPGAVDDLDPEYLHDVRTSVRATRSFLKLAGDLLPSAQVESFSAEFSRLGALTTPLRDLDVMLLLLDGHGDVDLSGLEGLDTLRRYLTGRRNRALRAFREDVTTAPGRTLLARWEKMIDRADEGHSIATREHAAGLARHAYKRIRRLAVGVHADSDPDDLHRLRKRCKQMRYLLDGYGSAFDPELYQPVRRSLKKLQDSLGGIQDAYVQRDMLASCATALARRKEPDAAALMAIGVLRERILTRDTVARHDLVGRLQDFCGPDGARRVHAFTSAS